MKKNKEKIGIQKHIRITDIDTLNAIDRVMELPKYKSLSKVINDALFYGMPLLLEKLFGEVKLEEPTEKMRTNVLCFDEKQFGVLVRLLKETVLNATINKSILSSMFHALDYISSGLKMDSNKYLQGQMSDTPDYLYDYELQGLKSLRQ